MSNSIQQSFVLHLVVTFRIIIIIPFHFIALLIIKLINGLEALHGPVSQLPGLTPADIH